MPASHQILSAAQMRAAEGTLIQNGSSVEALMELAGRGAAEWIWRAAARQHVTVLCGPGNNGGDGYVIARGLIDRGCDVTVIAAYPPRTEASRHARERFHGDVLDRDAIVSGEVFVDCLFGSGLTRALVPEDAELVARLSGAHRLRVAVDVPSGIDADSGALLSDVPAFDLTLALGAWKRAHALMPAAAMMGALRLVDIGIGSVSDAVQFIARPRLAVPSADAHKYARGLVAVVGGAMPGAAILAATAAQGTGAGYLRLLSDATGAVPHDIVQIAGPLADALDDARVGAILIGPGLGRDANARERLGTALAAPARAVLDADALVLLEPGDLAQRTAPVIATPHAGEMAKLERIFEIEDGGAKIERAQALARASGMIVVFKGPDTVVAAPDGRVACAARATSWLSTAGTGDVLAGAIASRLATGADPFDAACQGVWLHS
jgi:ADP-dependent NAD(P)H-hydrate dehydratase / NAD(P)H-hydrate epimerase